MIWIYIYMHRIEDDRRVSITGTADLGGRENV